jgi:hypothetical protein
MSTSRRLGILVGGTRYREPQTQAIRHSFDMLDLDAGAAEPARIPLDFLAHGFALHPTRKEAALLEKRGPGGCYVDLAAREVIRTIAPTEGHHFYGHGAFARDGSALFAVETNLATGDGVISVRDPASFAVIDAFPTYGKSPHDCVLVDEGRTLVVTNGGGPIDEAADGALPCVSFVDVASRKLLERHVVDEPRINTGHVALDRDRGFIVVSAPRDGLPEGERGGVSLRVRGRPLRHAKVPESIARRMLGESLSVCIHARTRIAVATHPYGHLLTFWNLDTGALTAAFDLANPRGVTLTLDERYFAVSFGQAASLLLIETSPLRPVRERDPGARRFSGSHVYTWAG